ncbi:MAG: flagellar hook-associated protein 3 FlgL [Actinomycetota bacterium]|nr:flagellar hook-associated protein 3 FlgL [Actinomycetota bacterium]
MSSSRITQNTIADTALRGLQSNLTRLQKLQQQLSSGRKVSQPSDDPSATVSSMTLRSRRSADEQFIRNIDQAIGRLTVTDNALTQLSDRLRNVRDLIITARNGALGPESLAGVAANVEAVRAEILDLYNSTYLDRPIFGGTVRGLTAVDASGVYVGDDGAVETRIATDAVVRVDVTGTAVGADTVPISLSQISANVAGGTVGDTDLQVIDKALEQVAWAMGDVGARSERVNQTRSMVDTHRLDLTSRISVHEDVDMPETIMKLEAQRVGYEAALQSAAKIQQISLVDFLK